MLKFKPAILAKVVQGAPLQLDAPPNFLFSDKFNFWAALMGCCTEAPW